MRYNNYILYYLLMNTYLIFVFVLAVGRSLDLISTWLVTPDLQLESNQLMKKLGWRNSILLNIGVIFLFPLLQLVLPGFFRGQGVVILATLSALLAFRNLQFIPMVKTLGQKEYGERFVEYYRDSKPSIFWSALFVKHVVIFILGMLMISAGAVKGTESIWFVGAMGNAFVFYSFSFALLEFRIRRRAKYAAILANA